MTGRIKVGLVGIGNCFSGLIQGIEYYNKNPSQEVTGIIHDKLAGYGIHDIDFVCGFDVAENKVGTRLMSAIYESPNMVDWIAKDDMPKTDAMIYESPLLDGVGIWVENKINPLTSTKTIEQLTTEAKQIIKDTGVEIIVSYLPVGSDKVTEFWAQVCLDTNTAFVNCIPSFIASDEAWAKKFQEKNIPCIGDDIKGQVGATIVHRTLAKLCSDRGTKIDSTYQINV
ncbi:MAG: myo-inositol-1-phosphate synthase, partial [Nitrosopumilus sp.]|nr:myo-inositol-1-phosphate synthase [Nitrosopumilus sp.]